MKKVLKISTLFLEQLIYNNIASSFSNLYENRNKIKEIITSRVGIIILIMIT